MRAPIPGNRWGNRMLAGSPGLLHSTAVALERLWTDHHKRLEAFWNRRNCKLCYNCGYRIKRGAGAW